MSSGRRALWRAGLLVVVSLVGAPVLTGAVAPSTPVTWGSNGYGQLGNGTTSSSPSAPAAVPGLTDVVDLHGGREHVIALTGSGAVLTWGSNAEGQLGLGTTGNRSMPTRVTTLSSVVAVETGHNHTLALLGDGTVRAWGLNSYGQLGDGSTTLRRSPVQVQGLADVVAVAAGRDMSYAIGEDGTAWAWGYNATGALGDGTRSSRLAPVRVGTLTGVTGIAGGRDHGLALRVDGSVWAWGWNAYGQVGDGTLTDRLRPVQVATGATEVAAGAHHSYALRGVGQVQSWGRNYRAELGDGSTTGRTRPVLVSGVAGAVSIGSGRDSGVAVLADGSVRAWGHNLYGQLGDGTTTDRTRAVTVPGVSGATKAGGGGSAYSVVLVSSGPVPNEPPTAQAAVACDGLDCSFDAAGSRDQDGQVDSYAWDFGDGTSGAGGVADHSYAAAGTYPVTLTVTDDDGATAQQVYTVVVSEPSTAAVLFTGVRSYDGNAIRPTVPLPAARAPGDQLVLFATVNRNATAATPAGWTLRGTVADGAEVRSWVFTRAVPTGTSSTSVQVALDAYSKTNLTVLSYSGAGAPGTPAGAAEPGTTALHQAPAAPVAVTGSTVVSYWADKPAAAHPWSLPANVIGRAASSGTGGGLLTSAVGDTEQLPAGGWPGATADAGLGSGKAIAWTVVLPPG